MTDQSTRDDAPFTPEEVSALMPPSPDVVALIFNARDDETIGSIRAKMRARREGAMRAKLRALGVDA